MENIKLILFNSKKSITKTTKIKVVNNRITIPPKNLRKNAFSGLLIPLFIESIPIPALKVVISQAKIKDLNCSIESTLDIIRRIAVRKEMKMNILVKATSLFRDVIYQVPLPTL
jgi:hypothetical protein